MTPPALTVDDLAGDVRRVRRERRVRRCFTVAASSTILVTFAIVATLAVQAGAFLLDVEPSSLWADGWFPREGKFGLPTLFVGSIYITLIAIVVAGPIGLAAAVYLSEYARPRVRRTLKPILEILAGIPSVIVGFFTLNFISPQLVQQIFPGAERGNLVAAGVGVGVLIIPLVASISEDALRSVPDSLREASTGLGARKSTTVVKVVLPAALSGIVAAFIVAISRALGETLVVTLAAGAAGGAQLNLNPTGAGLTMTAAMANLATGSDQVTGVGNAVKSLYLVGALLFVFTLGLNLIADRFVRRFRQAY
ncbi:MAG: phosphate ABC transporter permease subunit PstC [Actinomycetes bacterium]